MEVTSITKRQTFCLQKLKVKTMLVCFYDSKEIIHHEFVPEGQTATVSFLVFWNAYGGGFAVSCPSIQHQAVSFFFTTMHRFTGQLPYKNF